MINVTPYLKDIDAEIDHHRKTIATLKLKIIELEDMRVLMMQREEYRSAVNGHASPFGALHGVEIAVREQSPALPKPPPAPGFNKSGNKRGMKRSSLRPRGTGELSPERMKERIMAVLRTGPRDTRSINEALGYGDFAYKSPERRTVGNTLYRLLAKEVVVRDHDYVYALP